MNYRYTERELELRQKWRLSGICQIIFTPISIVLFGLSWNQEPHLFLGIGFAVLVSLVQNVSFWVLYHCAYRRPGTRCLSVFLWWAGLVYASLALKAAFLLLILIVRKDFSGWIIIGLALFALKFYWYSLCHKLHDLNKKVKRELASRSLPGNETGNQDQKPQNPPEMIDSGAGP